jgi:hypothetical protein
MISADITIYAQFLRGLNNELAWIFHNEKRDCENPAAGCRSYGLKTPMVSKWPDPGPHIRRIEISGRWKIVRRMPIIIGRTKANFARLYRIMAITKLDT